MPYAKLKYHRSIVPALLVATAALLGAPGAAQADAPVARQAPVYTGNYIVRWRDGSQTVDTSADTTRMRRVESNTGLALSVKRPMAGALQLLTVKDNKGDDPETVAKRLREDPRVADACRTAGCGCMKRCRTIPISPPSSSICSRRPRWWAAPTCRAPGIAAAAAPAW